MEATILGLGFRAFLAGVLLIRTTVCRGVYWPPCFWKEPNDQRRALGMCATVMKKFGKGEAA